MTIIRVLRFFQSRIKSVFMWQNLLDMMRVVGIGFRNTETKMVDGFENQ